MTNEHTHKFEVTFLMITTIKNLIWVNLVEQRILSYININIDSLQVDTFLQKPTLKLLIFGRCRFQRRSLLQLTI